MEQNTVDIYWDSDDTDLRIGKVILFNENEHGHAGYLAMKSIVANAKPDAYIMSHLLSNIVFNQTKDPAEVGWELYLIPDPQIGDSHVAVININEWPTTTLFPLEESKGTWIYIYPVVRDLLKQLKIRGAKHLNFFSALSVHDALNPDEFPMYKQDDIHHVNFKGGLDKSGDKNGYFFTPPTWLFPYLADKLRYDAARVVLCGYDPEQAINEQGGRAMAKILSSVYGLETSSESMADAAEEMQDFADKARDMQREMEELIKGKPANSAMWG